MASEYLGKYSICVYLHTWISKGEYIYTLSGVTSQPKFVLPPIWNLLPLLQGEQILSFYSRPLFRRALICRKADRKSLKLSPFMKNGCRSTRCILCHPFKCISNQKSSCNDKMVYKTYIKLDSKLSALHIAEKWTFFFVATGWVSVSCKLLILSFFNSAKNVGRCKLHLL